MNYRVLNSIYNYNKCFFLSFRRRDPERIATNCGMSMVDAEKWALNCIHGLHFWRLDAGFGVLVSMSGAAFGWSLLACLRAASPALDDGFSEGHNGNCQDI
jgi:hypothetical protein